MKKDKESTETKKTFTDRLISSYVRLGDSLIAFFSHGNKQSLRLRFKNKKSEKKNTSINTDKIKDKVNDLVEPTVEVVRNKVGAHDAFKKDTYRLIKATKKRFVFLSLTVFIGVAFMMGMISTSDIMMDSVDRYNDQYNLHDIQIYSQYGFCDKDVEKLENADGIENVLASKQIDAYFINKDNERKVIRLQEALRNVNDYELIEGRLPQKNNECVLLSKETSSKNNYSIGDKISVFLDNDKTEENNELEEKISNNILTKNDISAYLKNSEFTIVGICKAPEHLSLLLESSTLNNEWIDTVAYIPNRNFVFDYYTNVYVTLSGSKDLCSYTNAYNQFIDENKSSVESVTLAQQDYLKNIILDEANEEIQNSYDLLEQAKLDGAERLKYAKRDLDSANIKIVNLETDLNMLETLIAAVSDVASPYAQQAKEKLEKYNEFFKKYGINFEEIYNKYMKDSIEDNIDEIKQEYDRVKWQIANARSEYENNVIQYERSVKAYQEQIEEAEVEIRLAEQKLKELPEAKWIVLTRENHIVSKSYKDTCIQMRNIGIVVPLLFVAVAIFVCSTTMTRLVDEQRSQIGIFISLGYTNIHIICKYLVYAFLASIIGSLLGVIIGGFLFPSIIYRCWKIVFNLPQIKISYSLLKVLISSISFVVIMMAVTAVVINKVVKEAPTLLLRPKLSTKTSNIFLEKISFIWKRLSSSQKVTLRNIFRYKKRFVLSLIGVAGCTAILIAGIGINESVYTVIDKQYGNIILKNADILFDSDVNIEDNLQVLKANKDNSNVYPYMGYSLLLNFDGEDEVIEVIVGDQRMINSREYIALNETNGKQALKLSSSGIVVSEKLAKRHSLKKGDSIEVTSASGIKANVRIDDICEMYMGNFFFMSDVYYEDVFNETVKNTRIGLKTSNIDSLKNDASKLKDCVSIYDNTNSINAYNTMLKAIRFVVVVIIATAGCLAFVIIYNLAQVNIAERIREIASLKVLGFYDREVNTYVFKEIMIMTIIGGLFGLPLGKLMDYIIINVIDFDRFMFSSQVPLKIYAISFAITIIFTLISLLFIRKVLKEVDMVENLKSNE